MLDLSTVQVSILVKSFCLRNQEKGLLIVAPNQYRTRGSPLDIFVHTYVLGYYSKLGLIVIREDIIMPSITMRDQNDYFPYHELS